MFDHFSLISAFSCKFSFIGTKFPVNDYKINYEPWRSKAAIHAIAYHEPTGFLALGGGYLYDNEVHIFRLNVETGDFDKVWDTGDQIIRGDVMSLDFGDTDLNDFIEIVAGSSDGHVYVFEQLHIYDPNANASNSKASYSFSCPVIKEIDEKDKKLETLQSENENLKEQISELKMLLKIMEDKTGIKVTL